MKNDRFNILTSTENDYIVLIFETIRFDSKYEQLNNSSANPKSLDSTAEQPLKEKKYIYWHSHKIRNR